MAPSVPLNIVVSLQYNTARKACNNKATILAVRLRYSAVCLSGVNGYSRATKAQPRTMDRTCTTVRGTPKRLPKTGRTSSEGTGTAREQEQGDPTRGLDSRGYRMAGCGYK